jgi:thiol-disulfide isomerase/thioredoxin
MSAAADYSDGFPEDWYYMERGTNARYQHLIPLEGKPAPELQLADWIGDSFTLEEMEGKVVVVDFWGTWCPPCRAAIPKNIDLAKKHEGDVVVLGVHDSKRGSDRMPALAEQMGINYPLAVDVNGVSEKA